MIQKEKIQEMPKHMALNVRLIQAFGISCKDNNVEWATIQVKANEPARLTVGYYVESKDPKAVKNVIKHYELREIEDGKGQQPT